MLTVVWIENKSVRDTEEGNSEEDAHDEVVEDDAEDDEEKDVEDVASVNEGR